MFPDCLAFALHSNELMVGTMDEIQKLQITTKHLGESPKRICHNKQSHVFAVCTAKYVVREDMNGIISEEEETYVRFYDDITLEEVGSYKFRPFEISTAILSCFFENDPREYVVVGVSSALQDENEPKDGRLLVFSISPPLNANTPIEENINMYENDENNSSKSTSLQGVERELVLVSERSCRGAVYALRPFQGRLLAGIGSKVQVFQWIEALSNSWKGTSSTKDDVPSTSMELRSECGHHGHILALYLQTKGEYIAVGDLMRSISLLRYNSTTSALEEIAKDYKPCWMSAVDILDDDIFLGADINQNIFTVCKNSNSQSEEDRCRLDTLGEYHVGGFINKFVHGSLVIQPNNSSNLKTMEGELRADLNADFGIKLDVKGMKGNSTFTEDEHTIDETKDSNIEMKDGKVRQDIKALVQSQSVLFGCINGMVGIILALTEEQFRFFHVLQKAINTVVPSIGNLSHEEWRSFSSDKRTSKAKNFIDGDIIESFMDLDADAKERVVANILNEGWKIPVTDIIDQDDNPDNSNKKSENRLTSEDVYKMVEEMTRLH